MSYKLLLLDMDGTLVASRQDAMPSERVVQAVQAAQQHLQVAVVTGRSYASAKPVTDALGLTGYGVYNGGADVMDMRHAKSIDQEYLPVAKQRELIRLLVAFDYPIYGKHGEYGTPIQSPDEMTEAESKLLIEGVATSDVPKIMAELESVDGIIAHPTTSWNEGDVMDIHIMHHLASKRHGAEKLMRQLECRHADIIAISDSYNDVPMIEVAGLKIVMGNAPDEVKAMADFVTASQENDGVAVAIEKFILSS